MPWCFPRARPISASTPPPIFKVVGAYPGESDYDMCYGKPEERPQTDWRIAATPLPEMDPVFGTKGGLLAHWHAPVLTH